MVVKIRFLGHSSFILEDKVKVAIDPFKIKREEKADFIFITHEHFDHCSPGDVAKLADKAKTVIFAPPDCAAKLRHCGKEVVSVEPGKDYNKGIVFRTVPAYNIGKPFHPKSKHWVGYIIRLTESVYHCGDTDLIPEMQGLAPDIVLIPVGGTYTMDAKQAAEAVKVINPKRVIPMHYGSVVGSSKDARKLQELAGSIVEILAAE